MYSFVFIVMPTFSFENSETKGRIFYSFYLYFMMHNAPAIDLLID